MRQRKAPAGETGALWTEGGVSGDAFRPIWEIRAFFMLTAALSLASPLRLDATDRRAPLAARRRDQPPRIAPLRSALLSGRG
jgi:hypothetical protein